jgi:hypothetical protein
MDPLLILNMGWIRLAVAYGAPNCPVPRLGRSTNRPLSGKRNAPRLKFTELSDEPTTNGHLRQRSTATRLPWVRNVRSQKQSATIMSHWTVRCATRTGESNGRLQWATDVTSIGHWTVPCLVHTGLSSVSVDIKLQPTTRIVIETINTPTTTIQWIQAFHSPHSIQEQRIHSKDTFKTSISLQVTQLRQVINSD